VSTRYVSLGEVAVFIRGITFKPQDVGLVGTPGSVACMRTSNVQSELDLSDVWGVPAALVKRDDQYLRQGDILVSSANSWNLVGKCCWIAEPPWRATFGGFVSVLRADHNRVDPRFLYRWFASARVQTIVRSFGQRTTSISNLNTERCLKLPFPLLPLSEQRRIAEVLDRADALRANRRAGLAQLDILTQSIFLDMFGDPVANPRGWVAGTPLGDVSEIVSGITVGRQVQGQQVRRVRYLAVVNVQDKALDLSIVKTIDATEEEIGRYRLRTDDLLLTEGGDPDKLGRGTLWNDEVPECIHQNHIFRVRLTSDQIDPLFLNWLVGSRRGKAYFLKSAKQTTGIASINMTQLRAFPLLIPPLPLQHEFSSRIAVAEKLKSAHRSSLIELDALFAWLQHQGFQGGLSS
jgi:type I restriction enzyme, S subunit